MTSLDPMYIRKKEWLRFEPTIETIPHVPYFNKPSPVPQRLLVHMTQTGLQFRYKKIKI